MTRITVFAALLLTLAACQPGGTGAMDTMDTSATSSPDDLANPSDGFENETGTQ